MISDKALAEAIDLLRAFQSHYGFRRPDDDEDDAETWDSIDRVCDALRESGATEGQSLLSRQPEAYDARDVAWQKQLADALEHFWNPAVGAIQEASHYGPATGSDVIGAIAQGFAAIASSLRESATQQGEE